MVYAYAMVYSKNCLSQTCEIGKFLIIWNQKNDSFSQMKLFGILECIKAEPMCFLQLNGYFPSKVIQSLQSCMQVNTIDHMVIDSKS
jgi:hypothetical protein